MVYSIRKKLKFLKIESDIQFKELYKYVDGNFDTASTNFDILSGKIKTISSNQSNSLELESKINTVDKKLVQLKRSLKKNETE
jgi:hypothetical protein